MKQRDISAEELIKRLIKVGNKLLKGFTTDEILTLECDWLSNDKIFKDKDVMSILIDFFNSILGKEKEAV